MKSKFFATLTLLLFGVAALAQTVRITGTVTDTYGPVIGASVIESGTQNGASTDMDGTFVLNVKPGATQSGSPGSCSRWRRFRASRPG